MNKIYEEIIQIIEKDEVFKNVFTVPEKRFDSPRFVAYIDKIIADNSVYPFVSEIKNVFQYFRNNTDQAVGSDLKTKLLIDYQDFFQGNQLYEYSLYQLAYLRILLTLYVSLGRVSYDVFDFEVFEKDKRPSFDEDGKAVLTLYRGQSDYRYDLLPSIYRNLDFNGIMTYKQMCSFYIESGLYSKYEKHIGGSSGIDYSFVSFMQHSISYSPLLDFTTDKNIALIFGTDSSNMNYNAYINTDASIYALKLKTNSVDQESAFSFEKHNVQFYKNKLKFDSTIFGKPLVECTPYDFSVKYKTCLTPSNDRMKYQKGAFLYFERCVIVNGVMFFPFSSGFIAKYRIKCSKNAKGRSMSKEEIQKRIVKELPQLSTNHLLNPYYFFSEFAME